MKKLIVLGLVFLLVMQGSFAFSLFGLQINLFEEEKPVLMAPNERVDINMVLKDVNGEKGITAFIDEFEGETFVVRTENREIGLKVLRGEVETYNGVRYDHTLKTTENQITKTYTSYLKGEDISPNQIMKKFKVPFQLRVRAFIALAKSKF